MVIWCFLWYMHCMYVDNIVKKCSMMFHAFCENAMDIGAGIFVHSAIPQLPGKRVNPIVDWVTHQEGMDSGIHLSVFSTFLIISEHHFAFKHSALYWWCFFLCFFCFVLGAPSSLFPVVLWILGFLRRDCVRETHSEGNSSAVKPCSLCFFDLFMQPQNWCSERSKWYAFNGEFRISKGTI